MEKIKEYKNKKDGRILRIFADECPESPREWDNLGVMICRHRNYNLGDEQLSRDFEGDFDDLKNHLIKERGAVVLFPLNLYDHSGISISISDNYPYNCRWDSSKVGYIFATAEAIKKEFSVKKITAKIRAKVEAILKQEVETYDLYLRGEVYGFEVVKIKKCDLGHSHDDQLNSCWGFYGSDFKDNGLYDHAEVGNIDEWDEVQ
jgi:hypothetical protein